MGLKKNLALLILGGVAAVGLSSRLDAAPINIETVQVDNSGNPGQLSGVSAGGVGQDRICGSVNYDFSIGKFEVTSGQYTTFLNAVAKSDTFGLYNPLMSNGSGNCSHIQQTGNSGSYSYSVDSDFVNRPVGFASFWSACRFANWLNKGQPVGSEDATTTEDGSYTLNGYTGSDGRDITRNSGAKWVIPTENEWYKAAYHKNDGVTGNYWKYPTQSNTPPVAELPSGHSEPPGSANYCPIGISNYVFGNPLWASEGGAYKDSPSSYGTFDQGGNVWEWNETVVTLGDSWSYRGKRGGSFAIDGGDGENYMNADYHWDNTDPSAEYDNLGFRVAYIESGFGIGPEPATVSLLALGGLGVLAGKRRRI